MIRGYGFNSSTWRRSGARWASRCAQPPASPPSYAATNDDDFPRVSPPPPTAGRIPLGGEEKNEPLSRDKLRALVRALREHDELMLGDVRRLRRETASNISATLDHVAATLASDLEKMRILENLTEEVAQPMRSR